MKFGAVAVITQAELPTKSSQPRINVIHPLDGVTVDDDDDNSEDDDDDDNSVDDDNGGGDDDALWVPIKK